MNRVKNVKIDEKLTTELTNHISKRISVEGYKNKLNDKETIYLKIYERYKSPYPLFEKFVVELKIVEYKFSLDTVLVIYEDDDIIFGVISYPSTKYYVNKIKDSVSKKITSSKSENDFINNVVAYMFSILLYSYYTRKSFYDVLVPIIIGKTNNVYVKGIYFKVVNPFVDNFRDMSLYVPMRNAFNENKNVKITLLNVSVPSIYTDFIKEIIEDNSDRKLHIVLNKIQNLVKKEIS